MGKKLLVICGPTAIGKTSLAVHLSKVFGGEIVSADSRQVYRGMDIGTGKDFPRFASIKFPISNLEKEGIGCYEINGIRVWGYDLVDPEEDFSVSQYTVIAKRIIKNIHEKSRLPILVGGTGFYIKGVTDGIPTSKIPINKTLRKSLENKSVEELIELLKKSNPMRVKKMNKSDKNNPRRLVRAIEISYSKDRFSIPISRKYDLLFIGLKTEKDILDKRIEQRVYVRLHKGMVGEIKSLLRQGVSWKSNSMVALGYRQMRDYLDNKSSLKVATEKWIKAEIKYSKKQMTWFKKDKRVNWFNISNNNWKSGVEKMVAKWHN